jgi:CBS domain-containing protein
MPVLTCSPETSLREAAELMKKAQVGSVIVLDEHRRVSGIATDRDLVIRGLAEGMGPEQPIRGVMSEPVTCVYEDDSVFTAATKMASTRVRRLPVLDNQGALSAVVTLDDLICTFSEQIDKLAFAVRSEIGWDKILDRRRAQKD